MRLKRLLVMLLTLAMCLSSFGVYAMDYPFWIDEIGPEKGSIQEISEEKLNADIEKVRQIAMKYSDRYVVTQEDYVDTTCIDDFMYEMSTPLTLAEMDSGVQEKAEAYTGIYDSQAYKDYMKRFKTLSGPCNLSVYFEPSCYFQIYRNIYVIGGYFDYSDCNLNVENDFWGAVNYIQNMTREVIQPQGRENLKKTINDMYWAINNDRGLKVFIIMGDQKEGAGPAELNAEVVGAYRFE